MIVIVNTSARFVCQWCSTCSGFSLLNKRFNQSRNDERNLLGGEIDWSMNRACSCGGRMIWEPCTITGFSPASAVEDDWVIGGGAKAYP